MASSSNKLSGCAKPFREAGIDGNKLFNSTEADLIGIDCPRKELGIILEQIKHAQPQKGRPPYKQPVPTIQTPAPRTAPRNDRRDDLSGSEDDGWDEDEFSDDDDNGDDDSDSSYEQPFSEPKPPPRPGKHLPPRSGGPPVPTPPPPVGRRPAMPVPQDESNEVYDEPDKVQPRHGIPQPPVPTRTAPAVPTNIRDRPPAGVPRAVAPEVRRPVRPPVNEPEEEYEQVDSPAAPPAPKGIQKPKFKAPTPPNPDVQEFYVDCDDQPTGPSHMGFQNSAHPRPGFQNSSSPRPGFNNRHQLPGMPKHGRKHGFNNNQDEFCMDPELADVGIAPPPPTTSPKKYPKNNISAPNLSTSNTDDQDEFYMDPNQSDEDIAPAPPPPQTIKSQKAGQKPNTRPGRPLPNTPKTPVVDDDQDEFYMDPNQSDEDIAPAPPPPQTIKSQKAGQKPNTRPGRPLPNVPKTPVVDDDQDEFYMDPNQSDEDISPAPPPPQTFKSQKVGQKPNKRPGRPLPNVPKTPVVDDDQDEFYMDPNQSDEDIAPAPPPPQTIKSQKAGQKPNKRPGRPLPNVPKTPVVDDDQDEFYMDPNQSDEDIAPAPPPPQTIKSQKAGQKPNTRPGRPLPNVPKTPVVDDDQDEFYMDPNQSDEDIAPAPPPPQTIKSQKAGQKPNTRPGRPLPNIPKTPVVDDDQDEFYMDPNESDGDIASAPAQIIKSQKAGQKPNTRPGRPLPNTPKTPVVDDDQDEFYMDPNQSDEDIAPAPPPPQTIKSQKAGQKPNTRPGRPIPKAPVVDDDQDEFYMDPNQSDEDISPAPPPPPAQKIKSQKAGQKPNTRPGRSLPNIPKTPVVDDDQEFYEDPDQPNEELAHPMVPTALSHKPHKTNKLPPVTEMPSLTRDEDMQEDYVETDTNVGSAPPRSGANSRHKAPQPPQEDYEELDRPGQEAPPVPRHPTPKQSRHKPPPKPPADDQELYEFPDMPAVVEEDYEEPDQVVPDRHHGLPTRPNKMNDPAKKSRQRTDPLPHPPNMNSPAAQRKQYNSNLDSPKDVKNTRTGTEDDESDLERQKWFHGDIKRAEAQSKLNHYQKDGMYLIRKSSQGQDKPYTLQIFFQGKDYNLPIRLLSHNNQYALGTPKAGETTFPTLRAMVNFFKKNYLVLAGGQQTTLVQSLPKR